jgi:hypothetical protein
MIIRHCIYEEIDETRFMTMKPFQLVSNILKTVWNYY